MAKRMEWEKASARDRAAGHGFEITFKQVFRDNGSGITSSLVRSSFEDVSQGAAMHLLQRMATGRRWALALTACSFLGWSSWELMRPPGNAFMDLSGRFTDHFSHMSAARLFTRYGVDIWRVPLNRLLQRPTAAQRAALPADTLRCLDCPFIAPGWRKPVVENWSHVVRLYPPGDLVLMAPVAGLYHFTSISLVTANRLLLVLILGFAHAGLFLLLDGLLTSTPAVRDGSLLAAYLGFNCVLHWSLEGFYDSVLLVPLLLCWRFLGERRGLAAAIAYCAAAFLHFRAYYYAPWVLWALLLIVRDRQWKRWRARDWSAAAAALLLGAASLTMFVLILPGLLAFPDRSNPLLLAASRGLSPTLTTGAVIALAAIAVFLWAGSRIDALTLGWMGLVLTHVRQSGMWYPVAVVPWMVAPPRLDRPERAPLVFQVRVLVFLFLALVVHAESPFGIDAVFPGWLFRIST
jgi:hypothetical protein